MSDQRKLLTWTLNAGNTAYENDLEAYGNKIYALGVHEVQVEKTGECYIRRDIPSGYNGSDYGTYRYGDNLQYKIDKTTEFDKTRSFWVSIEKGMRRWKHIRHYLSFILFGGSRVVPMLDNVNNAQDVLIERIKATLDYLGTSTVFTDDPNNMKYIKGIEIDFEASMSGSTYANRSGDNIKFMNILKRIKNEICIPRGLVLQVNAYAMWGDQTPYYYRFHDYKLFATTLDNEGKSVIDELQIMTYDFAWNGSAPGASTPLWWFNNVAGWAKQNFGAEGAALKMNNVFFGSAGYGHRWGIYDKDRMYGSTITYRNFIDWQNGLYKHNHKRDDGIYEWHDQEFLRFAGFEDQESKNEILQQHVYDYFKARYGTVRYINEAATVRLSSYNGGEYLTTYSRVQKARFTNIKAESFAPSSTNASTTSEKVKAYTGIKGGLITVDEGSSERNLSNITGYQLYQHDYVPKTIEGTGLVCTLDESGKATYTLNISTAGNYKLIALVSFPWYNARKLGGTLNGSPFTIEAAQDYYPLMFKASHWYNCGSKDFQAGANTIVMDGDLGDEGTVIYGFIVCENFEHRFGGGEVSFNTTVKPFKKKDGTLAAIPAQLALTAKALRQDAIPLIMWDDRFTQYLNDPTASKDLTTSLYYRKNETQQRKGNGTTLSSDLKYCYDPNDTTYESGYSWGQWAVSNADWDGNPDSVHVKFGTSDDSRGRLLVNYEFKGNMEISTEVRVTADGLAGVQFMGTNGRDGYVFGINYATRSVILTRNDELLYSEPLPSNFYSGDRTKIRAVIHNQKAYFYYGYADNPAFGGAIDIQATGGGVAGLYANVVGARFYVLTISSTDKWDLMEKFTVSAKVNGQTYSKTFGAISRPNYTIDPDYGYLNYSGLNELETRAEPPIDGSGGDGEDNQFYSEDISLDYEFFITEIPGTNGSIPVTVTFDDPGIWFGHLYVADKQGASVTWVGDAQSFIDSMNRAVNDFGAKGIGLWTMGQEDPKVFDTIPEVVPYHK